MSSFIAPGTAYATHGRAHDSVLHLLLDVRLPADRRSDVAAGDMKAQGLPARRDRRPHDARTAKGCSTRTATATCWPSTIPTLRDLRSGVRLRNRGDHSGRPAPHVCGGRGHLLLPDALQRELRDAADARGRARRAFSRGCTSSARAGRKGQAQGAHLRQRPDHLREALRAQEILAERYDVSADVWSATSYKQLRTDALNAQRWNMLHPTEAADASRTSRRCWQKEQGPFVAVSDYMKTRARPDRAVGAGRPVDAGDGRLWPQRHAGRVAPVLRGGRRIAW